MRRTNPVIDRAWQAGRPAGQGRGRRTPAHAFRATRATGTGPAAPVGQRGPTQGRIFSSGGCAFCVRLFAWLSPAPGTDAGLWLRQQEGGTSPVNHCRARKYQPTYGHCAGHTPTRCSSPRRDHAPAGISAISASAGYCYPARPWLGPRAAAPHRRGRQGHPDHNPQCARGKTATRLTSICLSTARADGSPAGPRLGPRAAAPHRRGRQGNPHHPAKRTR